jgi:anti-sigma B factor antagonist
MTRPFAVQLRTSAGINVLELHGQIDGSAGPELKAAYGAVAGDDSGSVVLDFTDVDYINSTGIAHIVAVLASARAQHRAVIACGLSEHYREIFSITRLSDFMQLYPDVRSAVEDAAATSSS